MIQNIWLVPLLPLLGVIINTFFGKYLPGKIAAWLAAGLVGAAAALSLVIAAEIRAQPEFHAVVVPLYRWVSAGEFSVNIAFWVDQLSMLMSIIITGIGFLIHVYSIGYMEHDAGIRRYFVYLNLFIFAMLLLVLADNYLLMFLGWEGVGLCSYLLISFWFTDPLNAAAGKKAFIVNRIGDFAVLLGIFLMWTAFGSINYADVLEHPEAVGAGVLTAITLLFFVGCTGKSAQLPLYVWLPDAMAGPTPVSALIHAATMVTAGVYLLVRSSPMLVHAPLTLSIVAWIGALTAFFAATIALTQTDIKKVLAYSTVSQLGYMFLGVGAGAYIAAVFHLFTHAFFKALLFLGSGSVMHAMEHGLHHGEAHGALQGHAHGAEPLEAEAHDTEPSHAFDVQDMRNMGGLWGRIPITAWTFLAGALALAGFPGTSGFFSKDEILTLTQHASVGEHPLAYANVLYAIGLLTAFMTAFYSFRQVFMIFTGPPRTEAASHASESPPVMTIPLVVLALFALGAGLAFGLPLENGLFHHWLEPVAGAGHVAEGAEALPAGAISTQLSLGLSSIIALLGIGLAYLMYVSRAIDPAQVSRSLAPLYQRSLNKWYVDEVYQNTFVRFYNWLANWSARFVDRLLIDGAVNGVGALFGLLGGLLGRFQTGFVRSYALSIVLGLMLVAGYLYWQVDLNEMLLP